MGILGTILGMVGLIFVLLIMSLPLYVILEDEIDSFFKWIKEKTKLSATKLKPKTSLDREIAEEEKEIKFLTEQKAKIDRLNTLKSEKDRLYQEVNMDFYRCKECGGTKVSGFHFYDRRLGQHIPVSYCSDCGTPIN